MLAVDLRQNFPSDESGTRTKVFKVSSFKNEKLVAVVLDEQSETVNLPDWSASSAMMFTYVAIGVELRELSPESDISLAISD